MKLSCVCGEPATELNTAWSYRNYYWDKKRWIIDIAILSCADCAVDIQHQWRYAALPYRAFEQHHVRVTAPTLVAAVAQIRAQVIGHVPGYLPKTDLLAALRKTKQPTAKAA